MFPPPLCPLICRGVYFSYFDEGAFALKNLNCDIRSRENLGIIGRKGAGKSCFLQMIFRLAEPAGRIIIDGLDIRSVRALWSKIE